MDKNFPQMSAKHVVAQPILDGKEQLGEGNSCSPKPRWLRTSEFGSSTFCSEAT